MTVRAWGTLFVVGCLAVIVAAQPACKKKSEPQGTVAADIAPLPPPPAEDVAAPPPAADVAPEPPEATAGLDLSKEPIQPLPTDLQLDAKMVVLGKRLFFDPQLSADGSVSCASCHALDKGGADGQPRSDGVGGKQGGVNAPTVLNSGFNFVQFWDGRAASLEEQAGGPVANPIEMAGDWNKIVEALGKDESYVALFQAAFPDSGISEGNVRKAIAEYEKSLVTPSRFDAYLRGNAEAITAEEQEGYALFKSVGCPQCHNGVNAGGTMFAKLGIAADYFADRGNVTDADRGRFNVTQNEADRFQFKVPTLRNVELTSPYFHDAAKETIELAVAAMAHYQLGRELTPEEQAKIVAFLKSLTGEIPPAALPEPAAGA
jgi:cytochrome c peroxidase